MKKKIIVFVAIILSLVIFTVSAEDSSVKLLLDGTWSYTFSNKNESCKITGDKITNKGDKDTSFKLVFFLSTNKYSGGSISGYKVGSKSYDSLESGYMYTNISISFTDFEKKQPPTGNYYPVILLIAYKNGDYGILDYLSFSNPCYFKNYKIDEIEELLSELKYSKQQETYWTYSSSPLTALDWIMNTYNIETKLSSLGYDTYGNKGYDEVYSKTEKIIEFSAIPDKPKTTSSSSSNYSYTNISPIVSDYNIYDYSYSDNSSSSSTTLHKVTETCSWCNGTGKNPYDYHEAPRYDGVGVTEYCAICGTTRYLHTHKTCYSCHGTGKVEKWKY